MRSFATAWTFLTTVSLPGARTVAPAAWPRGTTVWFPVVGLLLGGVVAGVAALLPRGALGAASTLTLWTVLTGALHEDGLGDALDAAIAPVGPARRREILRDPRLGSYGVVGIVLVLLLRLAALGSLTPSRLVFAPVLGRWVMVTVLGTGARATNEGFGAAVAREARPAGAGAVAVAIGIAWTLVVPGAVPIRAVASGGATGLLVAGFFSRRLGGVSGDVAGASGLLAETAYLVAAALS